MSRITMVRGYSPPPQDAAMDYAGYGASSPRPSYAPIPALNGFGRFGLAMNPSAVIVEGVRAPFAVPATGYTSTGAEATASPGRSMKPLLVLGGVGLFLWWMAGR